MSKQILIVEDDIALRNFFEQVLSHADCTVTATGSRRGAVRELLNEDFDKVVVDIEVEDGNALDLVAECCDAGMDVLVITSDEAYFQECQDLGVLAFAVKPVSGPELIMMVHNIDDLDVPHVYVRR